LIDLSSHSAESLSLATTIAGQCGLEECTALHIDFSLSWIRYQEQVHQWLAEQQAAMEQEPSCLRFAGQHYVGIDQRNAGASPGDQKPWRPHDGLRSIARKPIPEVHQRKIKLRQTINTY
jgi:hypothetical protein